MWLPNRFLHCGHFGRYAVSSSKSPLPLHSPVPFIIVLTKIRARTDASHGTRQRKERNSKSQLQIQKTKTMKNILVPIDFSNHSKSAVKTAAFLAGKTDAQLHLLHVVPGPENWEIMPVAHQQENPEMESRMLKASLKMENFSKDSLFRDRMVLTHVKTGIAHERIVSVAKSEKVDLIVIGAHGAGESQSIFIGSTAQKVLRTASCPVLSVKENFSPTSIGKILFASDFEEDITSELTTVSDLGASLKANVELTFINTPSNFVDTEISEQRMKKVLPAESEFKFEQYIYNHHNKEQGILNAAQQRGAGMIAMVTHNRRGKPGYSLGITEALLFSSDVPVLSMVLKR